MRAIRYTDQFVLRLFIVVVLLGPLCIGLGAALDELGLGDRQALLFSFWFGGGIAMVTSWLAIRHPRKLGEAPTQPLVDTTLAMKIYVCSYLFLFTGTLVCVGAMVTLLREYP